MPDGESVEQTLGTMGLVVDTIPKHTTAKLEYDGVTSRDVMRVSATGEASTAESGETRGGEREADDDLARSLRPPPGTPGGPVKPGSEEAFFLLATYCFDLQRKMEYLFKATRAFALKGDPEIARQLLADERWINAAGLSWKQRALRAEARMLELQAEVGREHLELLRRVAEGQTGEQR